MYPNGGYTVPHRLSQQELEVFFERNGQNPKLQNYITSRQPPYGIAIRDAEAREFVVWWPEQAGAFDIFDLVVIDATGLPIIDSLESAPYEPPPGGTFTEEMLRRLRELAAEAGKKFDNLLFVLGLYIVWQIARDFRQR